MKLDFPQIEAIARSENLRFGNADRTGLIKR